MSLEEKMRRWSLGVMGDPNEVCLPPDDQDLSGIPDDSDDDEEFINAPETRLARDFLTAGHEYQWLLHQLQCSAGMTQTGDMDSTVRKSLSDIIGSHSCVTYEIDWNIFDFLQTQYENLGNLNLGSVLCLSGVAQTVQATSCEEYVQRMWPRLGISIVKAVSTAAIVGKGIHQGTLLTFVEMRLSDSSAMRSMCQKKD